jgi:hypothetical protein
MDVCPATDTHNLERLAGSLNELEAAFRPLDLESGFPPPVQWDARSFGSFTNLALTTRYGWLDIWFRPDGTGGYDDLIRNATEMEIRGLRFHVAALDDIIRNKQAVGGPKYLSHLPLLRQLRDHRRKS